MNSFFLCVLLTLMSHVMLAQKIGSFTDSRDGQTYETVTYEIKEGEKIKIITWLAENLKFATASSRCYLDDLNTCQQIGRYYQWEDAMTACPIGWRLPNDKDWLELVNLFGGIKKAGRHLKSKEKLWTNGNGTNKSAFSGMGYGASDGQEFFQFGYTAFFWSSMVVEKNDEEAYDWSFVTNSSEVRQWGGYKLIYNCVRCVRDK